MANETVLFKRGDSATINSTPVTDGQILFDTSGNGKMYLDNGTDRLEMGGAITVDASLSKTSTNAIQNKAVTGNILNSLAEVSAATQQNTIAGALALKEVNSSLVAENSQKFQFAYDSESGKYGYKAKVEGADTFFPFNGGFELEYIYESGTNGGTYTFQNDYDTIMISLVLGLNRILTSETAELIVSNDYTDQRPSVFIYKNIKFIFKKSINDTSIIYL